MRLSTINETIKKAEALEKKLEGIIYNMYDALNGEIGKMYLGQDIPILDGKAKLSLTVFPPIGWYSDGIYPEMILVDRLIVKDKNKGTGTEIMQEICRIADEHKVRLALVPTPIGRSKGMNEVDLMKFYGKFGFEPIDQKTIERIGIGKYYMIREPR